MGWRNFFPVVLLCQVLVLAVNRFWFYLLCTYVLRVQYSCGVVLVFYSDGKYFLVLRTYLVYNTVVRLCQFFGCGGKLFSSLYFVFFSCTAQIHKLKFKSEYYLGINIRNHANNANTGNPTLISNKMTTWFLNFERNNSLAKICFS
jgi:hypothetical protein